MTKTLLKATLLAAALTFTAQNAALAYSAQKADMFQEKDTNKDGKITKDEFTAECEKHFTTKDTNKDGVLTKEEVKTYKDAKHKENKSKRTHSHSGDTLDNKDTNK
jgi:hypothetical protein